MKRKTRTITAGGKKYIWWYRFYDMKAALIFSPAQDKTSTVTVEFTAPPDFSADEPLQAAGYYPAYIVIKKGDALSRIKTVSPAAAALLLAQLTDSAFKSRHNAVLNGTELLSGIGFEVIHTEMAAYW